MTRLRRRRGAALVLVVVVIAALVAIAAPFVISMRLHERTARGFAARLQARCLADAARNQAVATLMETHPTEERRAARARSDAAADDEGIDTLDELREEPPPAAGLVPLETRSATGHMAQVEVEDARGRIDLNACGPDAIANLLGVTVSTASLAYEEQDVLQVEDTSGFYSDGDPETLDGFVRIDQEYVAYRHTTPTAFQGLVRGFFFSRQPPPEDRDQRRNEHPFGSLVQDGRGQKVATDALWRHVGTLQEGQLSFFDSTAAIRRIADWEFGSFRAAMVLVRYGVTLSRLRRYGITRDQVLDAGLDPSRLLDESREGETEEQRTAREQAEQDLTRWGVPVDLVRRMGGDEAVLRVHRMLEAMAPEQRGQMIEVYRQRAAEVEAQVERLDAWMRDELRRQLRDLSEMRNDAPHIETIGRVELEEEVRPYVTTDSLPDGADWSGPLLVNHPVHFQPYQWTTDLRLGDPDGRQDARTRRFFEGMIVKVRPLDGRPLEFRICVGSRRGVVSLFPQLDGDYEASAIEVSCRQPRPINVNAASREVLAAALTGLQCRVGQTFRVANGLQSAPSLVTPQQARAIAEAIVDEPPANHQALRGLLLELRAADAIDDHAVQAVLRNAIDPADPMLIRAGLPFCYASGDVYELTATGIVNDPSGTEIARHRYREVVRVAPPRDLVWEIDSQADFTDRLYVAGPLPREQGQSRAQLAALLLPGRWTHLLQTGPVHLGPYSAAAFAFPSRSHAQADGDVRPLLGREPEEGLQGSNAAPRYTANNVTGGPTPGWLRLEHYDPAYDGVDLAQVRVASSELSKRWYQFERGPIQGALGPGGVRGWFRIDRPPAPGTRAFVFDGGRRDHVDRVSLYLEGPQDLVLRASDEAMDEQEVASWRAAGWGNGEPRDTELRYHLREPLTPGNWYHLAAFWRGSDRGDLALAVDGCFGQPAPGRVTENLGSRLAQAVDPFQTTLTVEDAAGFPPSGWVRVGFTRWLASPSRDDRGIAGQGYDANAWCEVLHYSRLQGNTLVLDSIGSIAALQRIQAMGGTVTGLRQDDGPPLTPLTSVPTGAVRRPARGSGVGYQFLYTMPPPNPMPQGWQQPDVYDALGFGHAAGTYVVPYGYQARVKNEPAPPAGGGFQDVIRRGQATLVQPLPVNMPATLLYQPVQGYTWLATQNAGFDFFPQLVDATATTIPVLWCGAYPDPPGGPPVIPPGTNMDPNVQLPTNVTGGWPPQGVVRISTIKRQPAPVTTANPNGFTIVQSVERVHYRGIDARRGLLLNCTRGVEGTQAAAHFLFDTVVLESIVVSDPSDYPTRADIHDARVYVSLDSAKDGPEWVSTQRCADPALDAQGLVLVPARDCLDVAMLDMQSAMLGRDPIVEWNGQLPQFGYLGMLVKQLLDRSGSLGPTPGLLRVEPPPPPQLQPVTDPEVGQPWKEVLKRWALSWSRACKGTTGPSEPGHLAGTPVIPTFAVRTDDGNRWQANWQGVAACEAGAGDWVTVADDGPGREERRVMHSAFSYWVPGPARHAGTRHNDVGDATNGWLVGLDDFVQRAYSGAANARLARWPTGNVNSVPDLVLGRARPPSGPTDTVVEAPGVLAGRVDDLVTFQLLEVYPDDPGGFPLRGDMSAGGNTYTVSGPAAAWRARPRLYVVDGEAFVVRDARPGTTPAGGNGAYSQVDMLRGALGTQPGAHSQETAAWQVQWPPLAVANSAIGGGRGQSLELRGGDGMRRRDGYVAIDRGNGQPFVEVLPYAWRNQDDQGRRWLERPLDTHDRGAFRSAFGSGHSDPLPGDLLVDLPFRPHDVHADLTDSLDGVFLQVERELPGAYVTSVEWDEQLPSSFCEVKVAVRLDGAPAWDAEPAALTGQPGALYVFDEPRPRSDPPRPDDRLNEVMVRADRVELRVYLTFRPGAFYQDAWKRGAIVGAVRVHYRQPTVTVRREERVD